MEPRTLSFKKIRIGSPETREAKLVFKPVGNKEIKIEGIEVEKGHFTAEMVEQTAEGATISVASVDDLPMGKISDTITVKTSSDKSKEVKIRVYASVIGNIDVSPMSLIFRTKDDGPSKRRLKLTKVDGPSDLRIENVESDSSLVTTEIIEVEAGKHYEIEATYSPEAEQGTLTGTLTISTNDLLQKEIKVPVRAYQRKAQDLERKLGQEMGRKKGEIGPGGKLNPMQLKRVPRKSPATTDNKVSEE